MVQRFYKRVSLSFHLPHFLLQRPASQESPDTADREFLGYFGPKQYSKPGKSLPHLYKTSSSVLLTLVVPQEQTSRQEEHSLISTPEALWNVIIINGSWHMAMVSSQEPVEYLTPLAQFIRAICSTVTAQKDHMVLLLQELKECLTASENDSLFDDRQFSKSRTYHWVIGTCHDLCASIQTNLQFLNKFKTHQLPDLRKKAHQYEICGLDTWISRLAETTTELEKLDIELHAFREKVRELVSFLPLLVNDTLSSCQSVLQALKKKTLLTTAQRDAVCRTDAQRVIRVTKYH